MLISRIINIRSWTYSFAYLFKTVFLWFANYLELYLDLKINTTKITVEDSIVEYLFYNTYLLYFLLHTYWGENVFIQENYI